MYSITINLSKSNLEYLQGKLDDEIYDCSHPSSAHKCPEDKCEFDDLFQQISKLLETELKLCEDCTFKKIETKCECINENKDETPFCCYHDRNIEINKYCNFCADMLVVA